MKSGIELIAIERQEQIEKHGFSLEKDKDYYLADELEGAAKFALTLDDTFYPKSWGDWWRARMVAKGASLLPKDFKIERLKIAGALIAAEIDRLQSSQ